MSSLQIQQVLTEIRALQARASGAASAAAPGTAPGPQAPMAPSVDFATLMKNSIDGVATMQNQANAMANAYEAGVPGVDLTKVMLEVQKAGLAFHALTEVRNKLLDAYTQVMNMSV
jgi:flagellar hook-basal body complex protein FliE